MKKILTNIKKIKDLSWKKKISYFVLLLSLTIFIIDTIYKTVNNITYINRESCFLFKNASRPFFLFYENYIELWIVLILGLFLAVILERSFKKYSRLYPKNPFTAFIYGSFLPVCACSTIPIITALRGKMKFRTIITFILAAPLLSPIIIYLSFSVLGIKYAILRIVCSFILAIGAGYFLELFVRPKDEIAMGALLSCSKDCSPKGKKGKNGTYNIFDQVWVMAIKLLPYMIIAGTISTLFAVYGNVYLKDTLGIMTSWYGKIAVVLIGIPLYVCNGTDIFMLKPFLNSAVSFPYGPAIAFSLSASAVCAPSIVLLSKLLGKRLTAILVGYILVVCVLFSFLL